MPADDAVYYKATEKVPRATSVLAYARTQMFRLFMAQMQPTAETSILDIGASEHETGEANFLEKMYPYKRNITCAGIGSGDEIRAANPDVNYVSIEPGKPLPFADKSFDIAYSNAVLEHVGGPEQRRFFLADALRVARGLFMTVPNRWFPVEHHTALPVLHFLPPLFRWVLRGTKRDHWSRRENLEFLSASLLRSEWAGSMAPDIRYTGIACGPFSSNIAIILRPRDPM